MRKQENKRHHTTAPEDTNNNDQHLRQQTRSLHESAVSRNKINGILQQNPHRCLPPAHETATNQPPTREYLASYVHEGLESVETILQVRDGVSTSHAGSGNDGGRTGDLVKDVTARARLVGGPGRGRGGEENDGSGKLHGLGCALKNVSDREQKRRRDRVVRLAAAPYLLITTDRRAFTLISPNPT